MTGSRPNPKNPVYPYRECLIANCSLTKHFYGESSVITKGVLGNNYNNSLEIHFAGEVA